MYVCVVMCGSVLCIWTVCVGTYVCMWVGLVCIYILFPYLPTWGLDVCLDVCQYACVGSGM